MWLSIQMSQFEAVETIDGGFLNLTSHGLDSSYCDDLESDTRLKIYSESLRRGRNVQLLTEPPGDCCPD